MDDQQTYLLNGLLTRQYELGRILRFRKVVRGRQAATYELLTAEQHEYLVQLYSPAFDAKQLEFSSGVINTLEANRFTVSPVITSKTGAFVTEGPQGSHMSVSISPSGSVLPAEQFTSHDISQVGLRLGWMHRLLREQVQEPAVQIPLATQFQNAMRNISIASVRGMITIPEGVREVHSSLLQIPVPVARGWLHGEIEATSLLHDSDHQLRTVTDWGLLHFGQPLEDLVDAFVSLCSEKEAGYSMQRGRVLLEGYGSLIPLKGVPWTPIVAGWCAQRLIDASNGQRNLPRDFVSILSAPEKVATAMAASG